MSFENALRSKGSQLIHNQYQNTKYSLLDDMPTVQLVDVGKEGVHGLVHGVGRATMRTTGPVSADSR